MKAVLETVCARFWNRLRFRWQRDKLARELVEELEFHTSMKQRESASTDASLTRKQMGNITIAREECREMSSFAALERLWEDLRYAVRIFRRTPGFTTVALVSLALGMGGNTAMYTLVHTLLLKALPYTAPQQLGRITGTYPRSAV